jgi:hypothetical protein
LGCIVPGTKKYLKGFLCHSLNKIKINHKNHLLILLEPFILNLMGVLAVKKKMAGSEKFQTTVKTIL